MTGLYYLENARSPDQRAKMERLESEGACLFCPNSLGTQSGQRILIATDSWALVKNDFPYAGTQDHFMLIPRTHVTDMLQLTDEELAGFWRILKLAASEYKLGSYGAWWRNGDPRLTGATIRHLHVQLAVSDPSSSDSVVVYLSSHM